MVAMKLFKHTIKQPSTGFTLIELMIAVAIAGVLAAIAIPSYQDSVKKSRRVDAQSALLAFANAMERVYTESNSYCDAGGAGGADSCGDSAINDSGSPNTAVFPSKSPVDGGTKYYNLTLTATSSTYTLRATPITTASSSNSTAQNGDGILELTNTGVRRWDRNNDGDFADTNETKWDN
jgi:type IV pilus assembly protein PilE